MRFSIEHIFRPAMTNEERSDLYAMLGDVDAVLKNKYCLGWGGLLGYVRYGKMSPWDGDIDLMCFDLPEYNWFYDFLDCEKYQITHWQYLKISMTKYPCIPVPDPGMRENKMEFFPHSFPFIDIASAKIVGKNVETQRGWNGKFDVYPLDYVLPFKRAKFGETEVNIPNKPKELIILKYGQKVLKSAITSGWDHRHERAQTPGRRVPLARLRKIIDASN